MKILYLILILVLSYSQILAQSERPETIVIPVATMGDVTETRKQILLNSLEENLKIYFKIISQDRFEQAQEKAFEELEYEECTEEQCIVLIQEMLQVENSFSLQVIAEGTNSQLSLTWITLDEKKKATDVCRDCDSFELNDRIKILVDKLISDKEIRQVSQLSNNEKENNSSLEEDRERKEKRDILVRERKKRLLEEGRKEPIRQSNLSDIQKEKYFDDFFSSRTRMLQFGYSESGLYFFNDKIIDNTTSPVRRLIHKGFNIGFKYYFQEKISFSVSYSSRTLDDVIHKMPHVQVSSMSGTSSDINLGFDLNDIITENIDSEDTILNTTENN